MLRNLLHALICTLLIANCCQAQEWAKKLFESTSHDFGTVARGAKTIYRFKIRNPFEETAHIASVRSSCGCTSPKIINPTLKTFEEGEILVEFNTRAFTGQNGATVTVTIDQPYPAEVQLRVRGYVRSDVVFHPGSVRFGSVDEGTPAEKVISVNYAGRDDWKVLDIRSANPYLEVEIKEASRDSHRVAYKLVVRLKEDAPAGYFKSQLVLVTDDQRLTRVPLDVEGHVVSEITVSPQSVVLGDVRVGEEKTMKLVVRGKKPFKILSVECDDDCFTFKKVDETKALHLVSVTFHPGDDSKGKIQKSIHIRTDRGDKVVTLDAYATVIPAADKITADVSAK